MSEEDYAEFPCPKCHKLELIAVNWYQNRNCVMTVNYICEFCGHKQKVRSNQPRKFMEKESEAVPNGKR